MDKQRLGQWGGKRHNGYDDEEDDEDIAELEFARDALGRISVLAADIGARKKSCTAGCLAAKLWIAKKALDSADSSKLPKLQRRLPKLLNDLERVCVWPELSNAQNEILQALVRPGMFKRGSQAEERARKGILCFADTASPHIRDQYFKNLDRFAKPALAVEVSEEKRGRNKYLHHKTEAPDEYPAHVNSSLFAVLKAHALCTCSGGGSKRHQARLRLRNDIERVDGCVAFDMLFSGSPTVLDHWQDLQLRVAMRKKLKKIVHYGDDDRAEMQLGEHCSTSPRSIPGRFRVISPDSFCGMVKTRLGSRICCRVQDQELHQLYDGFPITQQVGPGPGLSLRKVLESGRLSHRMKLVLAYILARSFWKFYDSPWMNVNWTSDLIQFLPEVPQGADLDSNSVDDELGSQTEGEVYLASNPYFVVQFDGGSGDAVPEYCEQYSVIYRYPRLMSLCILLLEIGRCQSVPTQEQGSMEANLNETWTMARRLSRMGQSWGDFDFPDYRKAIQSCLDYKDSIPTDDEASPSSPKEDMFARKAAIYTSVLQPLEKLLKALGFDENLRIAEPIAISQAPARTVELPIAPSISKLVSQQNNGGRNVQEATQWLDSIVEINGFIRQRARNSSATKRRRTVRIAVLDTGFDEKTVFFQSKPRSSRIKGWKDWVEGSLSPIDTNGHGTHTTSLIMKVAPAADIFVARIAKDRAGLANAIDAIVKAIHWAANDSSVDVVAMAFGFPTEIPAITRAILEAQLSQNNNIIFLAAAANSGGNHREMFPAFLDTVISIRETNPHGAFTDTNPPVDPHGPIAFGILGRDVPSAWLSSISGEVPKSGSSVATAVAAGIIGVVLDFVCLGLCDDEARLPPEVNQIWTRRGLVDVLTMMSHDMGHRSYYISPLSFFAGKDAVKIWTAIASAVVG